MSVGGMLAGLRVVDLTTTLMGPFATQILADMGADVIKVEAPEGDPVRGLGPARNSGMGAIFLQANRGKRSLVLNLKDPDAREALFQVVRGADAFVTSVRPKALARLGLVTETLTAAKPDLVVAFLTGYGRGGRYADRPAYDDLIQGASGLARLAEVAGAAEPRYVPAAIADRYVGAFAVGAILAALWHRERTGHGQTVEVPMFETMAQLVLGDHIGGRLFEPALGPTGYGRLLSRDRRPYPTSDGFVCAMIYNDGQWRRFLGAVDRSDLLERDSRFANITSRTEHIDEIYAIVAELMRSRSTSDCIALLESADIPVMPLHSVDSLADDEHLVESGFFDIYDHPTEGTLRMPGSPTRFSEGVPPLRPAPRLGEHTRTILSEAGCPDALVERLLTAGRPSAEGVPA